MSKNVNWDCCKQCWFKKPSWTSNKNWLNFVHIWFEWLVQTDDIIAFDYITESILLFANIKIKRPHRWKSVQSKFKSKKPNNTYVGTSVLYAVLVNTPSKKSIGVTSTSPMFYTNNNKDNSNNFNNTDVGEHMKSVTLHNNGLQTTLLQKPVKMHVS